MKILHTADWHLGKRLESFSRLEEQREVLEEICQIADEQAVDVVIVAGDLFDNFNPSNEATDLLYTTLHRLANNAKRLVLAIAGNHDSPDRIDVPDTFARLNGVVFVGFPNHIIPKFKNKYYEITKSVEGFVEIKFEHHSFPLRILHTPYANEFRLKKFLGVEDREKTLREVLSENWKTLAEKYCDNAGFNMLVSHLFFMKKGGKIEEEPEGEHPIIQVGGAQAIYSENVPSAIHYTALGHLHRYHAVDENPCPIVYSSSPVAYSFAEANQSKQVVLVSASAGNLIDYKPIALQKGKKLLQQTFDNIDEAVTWLIENQNALVQITIESDTYLDAIDKKRLFEVHNGLINIIPKIKGNAQNGTNSTAEIDLKKSREELFIDFFTKTKKGQQPTEGVLNAFRELLN